MKKFIFLLALLINITSLHAKPYIIFQNFYSGFFSIFQMALSFCECYENEVIQGGHFDFKNQGLYYDRKKGPNWWEYYFEPLALGTAIEGETKVIPSLNCYHIEFHNSREENHALIEKYIKIKPHILAKVESFAATHFKDKYVVGLHYRGTDKFSGEAPHVPYLDVYKKIQLLVDGLGNINWTIFLATDDAIFLHFLNKKFPGKICYLPDAARSFTGKPTHYRVEKINGAKIVFLNPNPYKNGEDALVDCLLLAKTDILYRTSSNLSFISSCFNPTLPIVALSERRKKPNGLPPGLTQEMLNKCKNKKDPTLYFKKL